MKQTLKLTASILLAVMLIFTVTSCGEAPDALWENATYTEDTTLGAGANTVVVEVVAGDKSVTLTIATDKATLGEAMFENGIVNDPSFFDTCNGIKADWDKDSAYWTFKVDGETAQYGIGDEKASTVTESAYSIVYTK